CDEKGGGINLADCDGHGQLKEDGYGCDCEPGYDHINGDDFSCVDTTREGGDTPGGNTPGDNPQQNECLTTFVFHNKWTSRGSGGEQDWPVYLIGDFRVDGDGNWNLRDSNLQMVSDGNGTHTLVVSWAKGETHQYKFFVDDWGADGYKADDSKCVGEYCNNEMTVTCGSVICYKDRSNGADIDDPFDCNSVQPGTTPTNSGSNPGGNNPGGNNPGGNNPGQSSSGAASASIVEGLSSVSVSGKTITIKLKDGMTAKSVKGGGGNAQANGNTVTETVSENNKYTYFIDTDQGEVYVPVWVEDKKFEWKDAFLYFAFTDRFVNGNRGNDKKSGTWDNSSATDWYGGDFEGMRQVVEKGYFDNLGVNTLWISSVTKNTEATSAGTNGDTHNYSAYHSYWPVSAFMTDYNQSEFNGLPAIEDHFGTMDELKALVDACHKRGIRVLVDFAANQVFKDSPVYAKHKDWFNDVNKPVICDDNDGWGWNNYSEKCWFSADLPDIDYGNAEARKTMVDHAIWLIKQTNIDGFRVDAVKHMNIQFIKDLRASTDKLFANSNNMFYMVGETFDGDINKLNVYIGNDLLHGQFDFQLYFAIRDNVLQGSNLGAVQNAYNEAKRYNSDLMGTFMGNHDVARALSIAAGQDQNKWGANGEVTDWGPYLKVKTAWTILLTNPGVPLVYYGDEYGQEGSNDPDNRRMMKFEGLNGEQSGTLGYVQQLGKLRAEHSALRRGQREDLSVDGNVWCYKVSDGSEALIVAIGLNNGSCDLKGNYKLKNALNPDEGEFETSRIEIGDMNKLNVYLVK
ncbi:MAG: hypothetical protein J6A01_10100, partial [Proteobacteria bacterium]|nr:hypothetical protein [Pseudomonadota bacterium]